MIYLLMYDIESDRIRKKITDTCENYGLERVQFSAFWGELTDNRCEELLLECKDIIGEDPARLHILPLCAQCFKRRRHYATAAWKAGSDAPRDRNEAIVFLPDSPESREPERAAPKPKSVQAAQAEVARKMRQRDKPLAPDEDPWG